MNTEWGLRWVLGLTIGGTLVGLAPGALADEETFGYCATVGYWISEPTTETGAYPAFAPMPTPTYADVGLVVNQEYPDGHVWLTAFVRADLTQCIPPGP